VDLTPQIRAFGEDTATADEAGEQVAAIGPAAIPALAAALTHEPRDVRQKAVEVLTTIGTAAAVPPLLQAAQHDDDVDVRADAVNALGTLGAERGRAVVEAMLADSHAPIRGGAVMACASLCTSGAAITRLADIAVMDDDVSIALGAGGRFLHFGPRLLLETSCDPRSLAGAPRRFPRTRNRMPARCSR
jgi:HEAT repeat protein